jgi:hypothetical protein
MNKYRRRERVKGDRRETNLQMARWSWEKAWDKYCACTAMRRGGLD